MQNEEERALWTFQQDDFFSFLVHVEIENRFPNGFFVKLNSRSPKDVPMSSPKDEKFLNIVNQSLDELPATYSDTDL